MRYVWLRGEAMCVVFVLFSILRFALSQGNAPLLSLLSVNRMLRWVV